MAGNEPFDREIKRGTLELLLLRLVKDKRSYGYELVTDLHERSGGWIDLKEGTLYPALHRLEKRGSVVSAWETTDTNRRAKVYRLTPDGRARLEAEQSAWRTMSSAIDRVLGDAPARIGDIPLNLRPGSAGG